MHSEQEKKRLRIPYIDGFTKAKQFIIPESEKRIEFADVLISDSV